MNEYLHVQKLINGSWVTTGKAQDLNAAARHADAIGGHVRVLGRSGDVIAAFSEDDGKEVVFDVLELLGAYTQEELGAA